MNIDGVDLAGASLPPRGEAVNILIVCTGNICRSPAAELILRSFALPGVHVESAGTEAIVGSGIDEPMRRLLDGDGIDAAEFRARQFTAEMVERSDIVLAAAKEHRRTILREVPSALRRTFTLLELADLTELAERDGPLVSLDRASRLTQLARLRGERRPDAVDDVADPYRRSDVHYREAYLAVADVLRGPISRLIASFSG